MTNARFSTRAAGLLVLVLISLSAFADVSVNLLEAPRDFGQVPAGAQCWTLSVDSGEGLPDDFNTRDPGAKLFCPECLADPRYSAGVPLQRIEQRLIPPPNEADHYSCDGFCRRWLLRTDARSDAALMLVRVGVPTLCGATGWCPGRIYEHQKGEWRLAGSYSANEANELCVWKNSKGPLRLWLTPMAEPAQTLEIEWRP